MNIKESWSKVNKRELYKKYNKFTSVQNIGEYWVGQFKRWVPVRELIATIGLTWSAANGLRTLDWWIFHHISIPFSAIVLYVLLTYYGFMFVNWVGGWIVIFTGLQKAQADINNKDEHLNPVQKEMIETIENIAKMVGAESKFTKL